MFLLKGEHSHSALVGACFILTILYVWGDYSAVTVSDKEPLWISWFCNGLSNWL